MTEHNFQIYSAAVTDRGLSEKRPQNEDSFLEMQKLGLFAVADGVGGAQAGDVASQMAMEILGEAFVNLQANGDAEEMMRIAIERANSAIFQMSSDLPQLSTMATTIVALHIAGNIATIGHVGDSRLYRVDGKGNLYRETQDHSVVEEEVRAGRMTAAQAANHPSRNVISRALGAESTVEVDMKTIMFDGNTKFLLCSDGITRHINDFELRELLLENAAPSDMCQKMKEICYSRGAEDNLTAVIVNVFRTAEDDLQDLPTIMPHADEEATVATARAAVPAPPPVVESDDDETPTRNLEMPASMQEPPPDDDFVPPTENFSYSQTDDESYLMEDSPPEPAPPPPPAAAPETSSAAAFSSSEAPQPPPSMPREAEAPKSAANYETARNSGSGFLGMLLSSLVFLVIGTVLGAVGYHFWQSMSSKPADVPVVTPQSSNVGDSTSEKLRKQADSNPDSLIKQYETALPKDASDFYFLGRAYLKKRDYDEAKKNFILARNNLKAVTDAETREILATDITQGLTIAQDKAAQAAYERERSFLNGDQPPSAGNSNLDVGGGAGAAPQSF